MLESSNISMCISFLTFLISMPPWKYEKLHKAFGFKIVRTELLSGLAEKIYFLDVSKLIEFDPFHLHIRLNVNLITIYSTWNHTFRVMEVTILRLFEKIWATFPQPDFPVTKRFFFFQITSDWLLLSRSNILSRNQVTHAGDQ